MIQVVITGYIDDFEPEEGQTVEEALRAQLAAWEAGGVRGASSAVRRMSRISLISAEAQN